MDKLALGSSERTDGMAELSRLASMHIDDSGDVELENGVKDDDGDREDGCSRKLKDSADSSQQNGKIPNRDSGIDSPSCAAEGEVFPNEDAINEEDHYDSVTETESVSCCVTLDNKRDSTQDEDSDLDEGSGGEIPSLTDTQSGYLTDSNSEAHKVSTLHFFIPTNLPTLSFHVCLPFLIFTSCVRDSGFLVQQLLFRHSDCVSCHGKSSLCVLLSPLEVSH